ncbi:hypothetical protein DFJ58DRAFT_848160 [Suillus subalutaceus]|uniref:uncharacterized protein n=1 Tax=Suillus subalutaceus TaxID=48586 RepID=UPI001B875C1F|nr:uncharacterized protein DFJ58DRAFT_848160 [Suillus subalutaceus]KAG1831694.1 hypothetical protein DFJ58DRAFT_848160 [Suillus subalutaceus]
MDDNRSLKANIIQAYQMPSSDHRKLSEVYQYLSPTIRIPKIDHRVPTIESRLPSHETRRLTIESRQSEYRVPYLSSPDYRVPETIETRGPDDPRPETRDPRHPRPETRRPDTRDPRPETRTPETRDPTPRPETRDPETSSNYGVLGIKIENSMQRRQEETQVIPSPNLDTDLVMACDQLVDRLIKAYKNPIQMPIDIARYSKLISPKDTGRNEEREEKLLERCPPGHEGTKLIDIPATILDASGAIIAWYLPRRLDRCHPE